MASRSKNLDWRPPVEPLRPPLPYRPGCGLRIERVEAPPPFAQYYWKHASEDLKRFITNHRRATREELKSTTQVDYCQSRPPLPCEGLNDTTTIEITTDIATGDKRRAQVVVCKTELAPEPLIAKIYDPLYGPFEDAEFPGVPSDPVAAADGDFTSEASAYAELDPRLGGSLIPKYHGSWKLELPLNGATRTVYLVLMEHVKWIPLVKFDAPRYPVHAQLNVVAKVMEADTALTFAGVTHDDLAPRNIFCDRADMSDPDLRVRVIDFNVALIDRHLGSQAPCLTQPLPVSPIQEYQLGRITALGDWESHFWSDHVGHMAWMKERWGGTKEYLPVNEELLVDLEG